MNENKIKKINALNMAGYTVKESLDFKIINKQGITIVISREDMDDCNDINSLLEHCEKEFNKAAH